MDELGMFVLRPPLVRVVQPGILVPVWDGADPKDLVPEISPEHVGMLGCGFGEESLVQLLYLFIY